MQGSHLRLTRLVHHLHGRIVLNRDNHRLEDIDIPALGYPQPQRFIRFANQPATQWNSKVSRNYSKNDWLSDPACVSAFHSVGPLLCC